MRFLVLSLAFFFVFAFEAEARKADRRQIGALVVEDVPPVPAGLARRLKQYGNTRSANFEDWDPVTGGLYISTRFGETTQIHKVSKPRGTRRQITFYDEPVRFAGAPRAGPHRGFAFMRDVGGGENFQIFFFDETTGRARLLTDGTSRNGSVLWSHSGEWIAFQSNRRNGRDWDVYMVSPEGPGTARLVYEGASYWQPVAFTPDDSKLLIAQFVSVTENHFLLIDLKSGQAQDIWPSTDSISYGNAIFSPDGRALFLTSDEGSEFRTLRRIDLESGTMEMLTADIPWGVSGFDLSPDGKTLAFIVNEGGLFRLRLRESTGAPLPAPDVPIGVLSNVRFSPDGSRVAVTISRAIAPGDVFVYSLADGSFAAWTESEVGGLDRSEFVAPELISYPTFDFAEPSETAGPGRRRIPAFLYEPRTEGPHPVVVHIHGGPESQYVPRYSPQFQFWVNELGLAVIAPNVRGSSGYGKSYLALDDAFRREDAVSDIGALLDWIAGEPDLDEGRVVLAGGSYGGYMVLAGLTKFGDRIAAGINSSGISNFVNFLRHTKPYRQDLRRVEYGDERDRLMREFLYEISPITNAKEIRRPLLVFQGRNDPRVPLGESEEIVKKVRRNGSQVWYVLALNEGHGFERKTNRDYMDAVSALFLDRTLNGTQSDR